LNRELNADIHGSYPLPEVSALALPRERLKEIGDEATELIAPFSRMVAKDPARAATVDGLLLLPAALWPEQAQSALEALKARADAGSFLTTFSEVVQQFGPLTKMSKQSAAGLQAALASVGVGVEPDLSALSRVPEWRQPLVLFPAPLQAGADFRDTTLYRGVTLMLQLGAFVATADGPMNEAEVQALEAPLGQSEMLPLEAKVRLKATLRLMSVLPPQWLNLRRQLRTLPPAAGEMLGPFAAEIAQADGVASPEEIKILEKVFQVLGLDRQTLYSELHAGASSTGGASAPSRAAAPLQLDPTRIAALREDTAKVSALLAGIFVDDEAPAGVSPRPSAAPADTAVPLGLVGLDATHSRLVAQLVTRAAWSRAEALDLAGTLDLMLDGALEQVNDACFDAHDMPLTEGDDPIVVNVEVLGRHPA
jgi:hypothetical protein